MALKKGSLDFVKAISEYMSKGEGFDKCLKGIRVISGGEGKCSAEFEVQPEHLNKGGGLHGGFTATIIDNLTTYALMSQGKSPGVSVDLNVSYLKAAKEGDTVVIDATTIKAGKTLAFLECVLKHKKDNSIIAKGGQTKYIFVAN